MPFATSMYYSYSQEHRAMYILLFYWNTDPVQPFSTQKVMSDVANFISLVKNCQDIIFHEALLFKPLAVQQKCVRFRRFLVETCLS